MCNGTTLACVGGVGVAGADYQARLRAGFDEAAGRLGSVLDVEQGPVAERLALLGEAMTARPSRWRRRREVRGVYLHGPVGRGKTWMVDVLLGQVSGNGVLRLHAYDSARRLHREVAAQAGHPGAVDRAVNALLGGVRLLFLDELHAHDPGDAMLLSRLLRALPDRNATLVATSNYPPRGLLPNPLHHHLVLPLVDALETACDVLELAGPVDHREAGHGGARPGWSSGAWAAPGSEAQAAFLGLVVPGPGDRARLTVGGRSLPALAADGDRVWVTFDVLCGGPTSAADMLEIADRWRTVVVSGVPLLADASPDAIRRFADMADVFWDRDVRLVVLARDRPERVLDADVRDRDRLISRLSLLHVA